MASRLGDITTQVRRYDSSYAMVMHPSSGEMAVRKLREIGNPEHRLRVDASVPPGEAWLVPFELAGDLASAVESDQVVVVPDSELTEHDAARLSEKYDRLMGAN